MSIKLRDLIRNVRACKTAAEERDVIAKECAAIRTAFKSKDPGDATFRHRNVAKLLYIHMLGYPTHFGQMECLKLIASPKFPEKRIGYLGLMVLLDERQKVLMLVTNSLKSDFLHKNPYIQGLALCSMGNICTPDMARDLSGEVEKFFKNHNPYIRKKAALCAVRLVRKVPELVDDYVPAVGQLLSDKNHAVLLAAVTLMQEIIKVEPRAAEDLRQHVPAVVKLLKALVLAGYVGEYDVVGVTDPFLQCKCIQLLGLLGRGSVEASDLMNDILAQVAINADPNKNPGIAILYDTVNTIMSIESESGLRVLAINLLGRFLLNQQNNVRYVALNTLCRVVDRDAQAIQRHSSVVVDCLKDPDVSIRHRALDLVYALCTPHNARPLVKELIDFLIAAPAGDVEFRTELTDKICIVIDKFAPNPKWQIDTTITVLEAAGNMTRETVWVDLIGLISRNEPLHAYATHKLFQSLTRSVSGGRVHPQLPLVHVGVWAAGEFGDLLMSPQGAQNASAQSKESFAPVGEVAVLDLMESVLRSPESKILTKEYALNALAKLSTKVNDKKRVAQLLSLHSSSMVVELQQRSVEYGAMLSGAGGVAQVRSQVLARMPAMPPRKDKEAKSPVSPTSDFEEEEDVSPSASAASPSAATTTATSAPAAAPAAGAVPDLMAGLFALDLFNDQAAPAPAQPAQAQPQAQQPAGGMSFLNGLFDASPAPSVPVAAPSVSVSAPVPAANPLDFDMFAAPVSPSPSPASPQALPGYEVHRSPQLAVRFTCTRTPSNPNETTVTAYYVNLTDSTITNFEFQLAVLKFMQLSWAPASSSELAPHSSNVSQIFTLACDPSKKMVVRVRINYTFNGQTITETAQISDFRY